MITGVVSVLLAGMLIAANLYWGNLNQDEGWYLYAAGQVAQGKLPYLDFAFTQAPAMPLVYALAWPLLEHGGVAAGRGLTGLLGLLGALLAARLARALAPPADRGWAGLLAFILIGLNVYQSYFTTVVKTYALCSVFLVGGLLAVVQSSGKPGRCFWGGLLLAAAGGTRTSAGVAALIVFVVLALQRDRPPRRLLYLVLGGLAGAAVLVLPWLILAPQGFLFGVWEYHKGRDPGSLGYLLTLKAGFVSRWVQAYFVAAGLWLALVLTGARWWRLPAAATGAQPPAPWAACLWAVVIGISLVHLITPFPYDDYQVVVYPVLAAALAAAWARRLPVPEHPAATAWRTGTLGFLLLLTLAAAGSSPINQDWFIRGRDRIWWRMKEQPDLARLRDAGRWLRARTQPGDLLLTQDTYLAVEAGMQVPPGLEMGPFSYYPDLPTDQARALHVVNRELLVNLISTCPARFAAASGYGFSMAAPEIRELDAPEQEALWELLAARYTEVRQVPYFGQGHTLLRMLEARAPALGSGPAP